MRKTDYFKSNYAEARRSLLDNIRQLQNTIPNLVHHSYLIPSKTESDLYLDSLYIPPLNEITERLLILTSGVHGIEGHTGSALQNLFIQNNFFEARTDGLGILILHTINPYGMKTFRRVTENNVDLNRNFDLSPELFKLKNAGYSKVSSFLNPRRSIGRFSFYVGAVFSILKHSMDTLKRAIVKGQYEEEVGIFFGGKKFEIQKEIVLKELNKYAPAYKKIMLIDLHTGYGARGKLHLFADHSPFLNKELMLKAFQGLKLDFGAEKDFYEVTGGLTIFMAKVFHEKALFAGICFEFGTINNHKLIGSLEALYRLIQENSQANHGEPNEHSPTTSEAFKQMFYPASERWREQVAMEFESALKIALENFSKI